MKKVLILLSALAFTAGIAFASSNFDGDKDKKCCKKGDKKECKKDDKECGKDSKKSCCKKDDKKSCHKKEETKEETK